MKAGFVIKHILKRLAILVIPLLGLCLLYYFFYDPHKHCYGDVHRHKGGPMGYVLFAGAIIVFWGIALLAEIVWRLIKKDKSTSFVNLFLIIFLALFLFFAL